MNNVMNGGFLAKAMTALRNIKTRTWVMIAAAIFFVLGLILWAVISLLSWAWAQGGELTETGKRLGGEVVAQVGEVVPGVKEQLEQVVPGLKEQLGEWIPEAEKIAGMTQAVSPQDVSGADIGPVARFPGLVRSYFARDAQQLEVRYAGSGAFDQVLSHYVQGYTAKGFTQEVMSASAEGEVHRFSQGKESIELSLNRRASGKVEVRIKQSPSAV